MLHLFVVWLGCFLGSMAGAALARGLLDRSLAKRQIKMLRAWIERLAQPQLEQGPHRSSGPPLELLRPPESPPAAVPALRGTHSRGPPGREPPPPTSVPGPGRPYEE